MTAPDLDLADAVDRAARKWAELGDTAHRYDVDGIYRHAVRQHVLPIVQAAAPAIARQAWGEGYVAHERVAHRFGDFHAENPWEAES